MANILILICMHLLGDFYFQTSKMAKCKNALISDACGKCKKCKKGAWINAKFLCIHSLIYMIPFLLLFSLTDWINAIMMIAVLGFVHGLIDFFTCFIKHKLKQTIGFLADQTLHIVSIAAVVKILTFKSGLDEYYISGSTSINEYNDNRVIKNLGRRHVAHNNRDYGYNIEIGENFKVINFVN